MELPAGRDRLGARDSGGRWVNCNNAGGGEEEELRLVLDCILSRKFVFKSNHISASVVAASHLLNASLSAGVHAE